MRSPIADESSCRKRVKLRSRIFAFNFKCGIRRRAFLALLALLAALGLVVYNTIRATRTIMESATAVSAESLAPRHVLLLGMHHSMTSVLVKALVDYAGYYPGGEKRELIMRRDNPLKYWEPKRVVRANQAYFDRTPKQTIRGPYNWLGYGLPNGPPSDEDPLWIEAENYMANLRENYEHRNWVVKDPRTCLVADPWLRAGLKVFGTVSCVLLVRDPLEASHRFLDYNLPGNSLSVSEWFSVWEQYTLRALHACFESNVDVYIVRYESLGADLDGTTKDLLQSLGVPLREDAALSTDEGFAEKHRLKRELWRRTSVNLPTRPTSELYSKLSSIPKRLIRLDAHSSQQRDAWRFPIAPWNSLKPRDPTSFYALVCEGHHLTREVVMRNARVALRSIYSFDSTRRLVLVRAKGIFESGAHEDWRMELSRIGWDVSSTIPEGGRALEIPLGSFFRADPEPMWHSEDASTLVMCSVTHPCEDPVDERMREAFAAIPGRTSDS